MGPQNRKSRYDAVDRFDNNPIDRYQSLTLKESLSKPSKYIFACKELSFLLKNAYSKFPKNLQSIVFQDTLFAFSLLPQMETQSAISAANSLLQSAEFAFPKQKRALAVTEYKQAVVASKRKSKTNKEEQGFAQLPLDVLVSIFSFLDVQSLLSASAVSRSWNVVASDNHLWKLLYDTYFYQYKIYMEDRIINGDSIDYRFAFKAAYKESGCRKFKSYRGYCSSCCSIVWLYSNKCCNKTNTREDGNHQIKPISIQQIVEFILDGVLSSESSSDSDSDAEDSSVFRLWAYPRQKFSTFGNSSMLII
ncbi:hypothetical protein ACS0TY_004677 [Phlomoides rotata]